MPIHYFMKLSKLHHVIEKRKQTLDKMFTSCFVCLLFAISRDVHVTCVPFVDVLYAFVFLLCFMCNICFQS